MRNSTSKKLFSLMALMVFFFSSRGQISIIASDFEPPLQLGETYTSYMDRTTTQVDIGSPGQSSWDFSNLVASNEFVTESKTVGSSPYAADFTGAGYASNYEGIFEGTYSNTWVYNSISSSAFLTHGTGTVANTSAGNTTTKIKYSPAWQQYTFPVEYGSENTYSGTQTVTSIITIPGLGEYPTTINQQVTVQQSVDGYGILKMPDGKRLNALRIKEVTTFNNNGTVNTSLIYRILAKSGEFVTVTPSDQNATSGVVSVSALSWGDGRGESLPEEEIPVADPSGLTAKAGESSIQISWIDNSDNETGFKLERKIDGGDFAVIAELEANSTSYTDETAEAGVTYIYRVMAYNAEASSGYSNTSSAMIETPVITVADPSELTAKAGESNIQISWIDNSDNETGFKLERKIDGGDFAVIAELEANSTSYTDETAEAGVTYIYHVMAYNADATSEYSNTSSAMIETPVITVAAPSELTATASATSIQINWTDNSDNETDFKLERKIDGGDFAVIAELEANSTSYTDETAETGVTYIYRVMAYNANTSSGYSNTSSAKIEEQVITVAAPSELTATAGATSIQINWTDNSDNETGFKLERKIDGGDFAVIAELEANSTSYTDETAEAGVTYIYRLMAYNADATSEYSNSISATIEKTGILSVKQNQIELSNFPNPFSTHTTIRFVLPQNDFVTVSVLTLNGKLIQTLVNENLAQGEYQFNFDGNQLNSGIYLYSIQTSSAVSMNKMLIEK